MLLHGLLHIRQRNRLEPCTPWVTAKGTHREVICLYAVSVSLWEHVLEFCAEITALSLENRKYEGKELQISNPQSSNVVS